MQPILDIHSIRPNLFTYSLGMTEKPWRHCDNFFESVERCLLDAGSGLDRYFENVQIRLAGFSLGSYPVARMTRDPMGLFDELMARVVALYQARAAPRTPPSSCCPA
jgi:hypothetical protein